MATAVQQRRGNTSEHSSFTGLEAEITVNTETKTIHVHDGSTAGGIPLAKASDVSNVATQITTADESSDAECFPVFTTEATGNLAPKTDTAFKYNASNGAVTASAFVGSFLGDIVGNVQGNLTGTATLVTVSDNTDDTAFPVVFHGESSAGTLLDDTGEFTYNPNDGVLTVPFRLDLAGQGSAEGSQINFSDGNDADFFTIKELNSDINFFVTGSNADMLFTTSHSSGVYKFNIGVNDLKVEIAHDNTTIFHDLIVDQGTIALKDSSDNVTTIQENAGGNITLTLPSSEGTLALTSDLSTFITASSSEELTNKTIDADQLSGTIDNARLPSSATNITSLGTLTALTAGATTVNGALTVNDNSIEIVSTDAGSTVNPILSLYRNSASPAVSDDLGAIQFHGEDDGGNKTLYAQIHGFAEDETGGTEDGQLHFSVGAAGGLEDPALSLTRSALKLRASNDLILEATCNIRFEGDTATGGHRTTLYCVNPTQDNTVLLPNVSSTLAHIAENGGLQNPALSSNPSSPANGQTYYNTTEHKLKLYANGAWVDLN